MISDLLRVPVLWRDAAIAAGDFESLNTAERALCVFVRAELKRIVPADYDTEGRTLHKLACVAVEEFDGDRTPKAFAGLLGALSALDVVDEPRDPLDDGDAPPAMQH